jgi:hypothetical protein
MYVYILVFFLFSLKDTFWTNPQYRVEVVDADEHDDDNTGTIIIGILLICFCNVLFTEQEVVC